MVNQVNYSFHGVASILFSQKIKVFTGLIQSTGTVSVEGDDRLLVTIDPHGVKSIVTDIAIGDSIAVDGVCLTVEEFTANSFVVTASPETLSRSTLGHSLQRATKVNLETSLRVGSKIGGHFVSGHVDGIGCLVESIPTGKAWEMTFTSPPGMEDQWEMYISRYIVSKGSIAVNGVSLTVSQCHPRGRWFKVAVIPVTYGETNLSRLEMGDVVNLEGDILSKYVERLIGGKGSSEEISLEFLSEHGY
ncbi:MAG: Riboflavin synthase [Chroococcopsis gigantea SAG 12.99]|nr:Riboflavin synthase [Chroococcopsis gigantea SAG 12.99]